jgi:hypothetical protein
MTLSGPWYITAWRLLQPRTASRSAIRDYLRIVGEEPVSGGDALRAGNISLVDGAYPPLRSGKISRVVGAYPTS